MPRLLLGMFAPTFCRLLFLLRSLGSTFIRLILFFGTVLLAMLLLPLRRKRRFLRQLAGELKRREGSPRTKGGGD